MIHKHPLQFRHAVKAKSEFWKTAIFGKQQFRKTENFRGRNSSDCEKSHACAEQRHTLRITSIDSSVIQKKEVATCRKTT